MCLIAEDSEFLLQNCSEGYCFEFEWEGKQNQSLERLRDHREIIRDQEGRKKVNEKIANCYQKMLDALCLNSNHSKVGLWQRFIPINRFPPNKSVNKMNHLFGSHCPVQIGVKENVDLFSNHRRWHQEKINIEEGLRGVCLHSMTRSLISKSEWEKVIKIDKNKKKIEQSLEAQIQRIKDLIITKIPEEERANTVIDVDLRKYEITVTLSRPSLINQIMALLNGFLEPFLHADKEPPEIDQTILEKIEKYLDDFNVIITIHDDGEKVDFKLDEGLLKKLSKNISSMMYDVMIFNIAVFCLSKIGLA